VSGKAKVSSEAAAWEAMLGFLDQLDQPGLRGQQRLALDRARGVAVDMLAQVRRGVHANPPVIIWPNPGASDVIQFNQVLSERAYAMSYRHIDDRKDYEHDFAAGVRVISVLRGDRATVRHQHRDILLTRPDGQDLWAYFPRS
jgi:hypothetical protein